VQPPEEAVPFGGLQAGASTRPQADEAVVRWKQQYWFRCQPKKSTAGLNSNSNFLVSKRTAR
jgi:hypothetical protein